MSDQGLLLLQQIADNTSHDSLWVALVAGGSALIGASIAAWLGYISTARSIKATSEIERQKIRASVVTVERLRWIQDLRSKVAHFYTYIEMQISHLERPVGATEQRQFQKTLDDLSMEAMNRCYSILPMLDRDNTEQAILYDALNQTLEFVNQCFGKKTLDSMVIDRTTFVRAKKSAFDALESIGKRAWEKVQGLQ